MVSSSGVSPQRHLGFVAPLSKKQAHIHNLRLFRLWLQTTRDPRIRGHGRPRRRGFPVAQGFLDALLRNIGNTSVDYQKDELAQALYDRLVSDHPNAFKSTASCSIFPNAGRGLIATVRISPGQNILSVPLDAIVTPVQAALLSKVCQHALSQGKLEPMHPLPDWSILALWLAELLAGVEAQTTFLPPLREVYKAYGALLPAATGGILEWSPEEVSWLRGSQLHDVATDIRQSADASIAELMPLIQRAERDDQVPYVITPCVLRRAFSLLLSRLVRLDGIPGSSSDMSVDSFCPWADLVNHDSAKNDFLQYDAVADAVVLRASRSYAAGEQIMACYGQKTSGELLLSYGFTPTKNPYEGCLLAFDVATYPDAEWKIAALHRRGLLPKRTFSLRLQAIPQGILNFAAYCAMPVRSAEHTESLCAALLLDETRPLTVEEEKVGEQTLLQRCKDLVSGYPVDIESAKAELRQLRQSVGGHEDSMNRRVAVLQVLIEELRTLHRTVFVLRSQSRSLKRAAK